MYSILRPVADLLAIELRAPAIVTLTDPGRQDEIDEVTWSGDGRILVYRAVDPASYRETLMRWRVGTDRPESLLTCDEALGAVSVSSDGTSVAFTAMTPTSPADGFVVRDTARRRLTTLNPDLTRFRFVAPEIFDFHSADGKPQRGLLYKPEGASADLPVPVVTYVYEQLTPQKNRFNPEAQLHVAHGYAYLMPDVLITPGYTGESFVKSVVPAVNAVRAMGLTTGRFGITGGSFGGYAGLFLISHVDVFSAAVLRAPPSEFFSTWGSGRDRDIWTIETGQARTGGTPWEVPERYVANSPFFQADRVQTPVLILHGEKDFTVPFQQGEMMFYALRALGRTAEFAIYREGDHSIIRGSRDDFLDVYQRTLDWWDRHLREP
jgi:dipeptidyl aminopeptidase/acylaminoacyl peptidase